MPDLQDPATNNSVPDNPAALEQLADAHCRSAQEAADPAEKRDLLLKAITLLERAAQICFEKKLPPLALKLASLHLHYSLECEDSHVEQGIAILDKARPLSPLDARIDYLSSQLQLCLGKHAEAEKLFAEAEKKSKGKNLDWLVYPFHRLENSEELLARRYQAIALVCEAIEARITPPPQNAI